MKRFWDCAAPDCQSSAAIDIGGCERCQSMFCSKHIRSAEHACPSEPLSDDQWRAAQTAELTALSTKINEQALLQRASQLSGGKACHLDEKDRLGRSLMGGMNIHLQIHFQDGTTWLARIVRENYTSFDNQFTNDILLSECATLQWLHSIAFPAPKLHGYGLRGDPDNAAGVAYMLTDKVPGQPFNSYLASEEQRSKVLNQWAQLLHTLSDHPFDSAGSLVFGPGETIGVGSVACDRTGTLPSIGPFHNAKDMYTSWADTYRGLIADGQLFSTYAMDAYLMFTYMHERIQSGLWLEKWDNLNSGPFYLKHMDDKGDHIMVDDEYNITGIIDWTFARVVPAYEAFGPSLMTANNDMLFSGKPDLSDSDKQLAEELHRLGTAHCYYESDEIRRLQLGLGLGLGFEHEEAIAAFQATVSAFQGEPLQWEDWRKTTLDEHSDDFRLSALQQRGIGGLQVGRENAVIPVPRFATCSTQNCGRASVRGRSCSRCERHMCAIHILPRYHNCPSSSQLDNDAWEKSINDEVDTLLALANTAELERVASNLRGGKACRFSPGKHLGRGAIMGCANYHAWILFDDGVKWLARIPRVSSFSDIPQDLVDHFVQSEYATLKWLEGTDVPAPRAHGFGLASDPNNLVGLSYLLEDVMLGQPFYASQASSQTKEKVYSQYARILGEISRHPRPHACSLVPQGQDLIDGAIASDRFISLGQHGPYKTSLEYFTTIADLHLDLIADGQIYPEYPRQAFVFYMVLRDMAAPILAEASEAIDGFFLKHVDDKGDHLLVDKQDNITAVIDWQFARFVPAPEAFGPSLFSADMNHLYTGTVAQGGDDQKLAELFKGNGEDDLAKLAASNDLARRFQFGLASGLFKEEVCGMLGAILKLVGSDEQVKSCGNLEGWMEREWEKLAGEPRWEKVTRLTDAIDEANT